MSHYNHESCLSYVCLCQWVKLNLAFGKCKGALLTIVLLQMAHILLSGNHPQTVVRQ